MASGGSIDVAAMEQKLTELQDIGRRSAIMCVQALGIKPSSKKAGEEIQQLVGKSEELYQQNSKVSNELQLLLGKCGEAIISSPLLAHTPGLINMLEKIPVELEKQSKMIERAKAAIKNATKAWKDCAAGAPASEGGAAVSFAASAGVGIAPATGGSASSASQQGPTR